MNPPDTPPTTLQGVSQPQSPSWAWAAHMALGSLSAAPLRGCEEAAVSRVHPAPLLWVGGLFSRTEREKEQRGVVGRGRRREREEMKMKQAEAEEGEGQAAGHAGRTHGADLGLHRNGAWGSRASAERPKGCVHPTRPAAWPLAHGIATLS